MSSKPIPVAAPIGFCYEEEVYQHLEKQCLKKFDEKPRREKEQQRHNSMSGSAPDGFQVGGNLSRSRPVHGVLYIA